MDTQADTSPQLELADANIATVREFIAAINAWDFAALRRLCHPDDYVFTIPFVPEGFPPQVVGAETWVGFVEEWSKQLDGSENLADLQLDALAHNPGEIFSTYTADMLLKTGHRYRNRYVGRFLVRDGFVTRFDEYLDSIPLLIAAGGTTTPPPNQVLSA